MCGLIADKQRAQHNTDIIYTSSIISTVDAPKVFWSLTVTKWKTLKIVEQTPASPVIMFGHPNAQTLAAENEPTKVLHQRIAVCGSPSFSAGPSIMLPVFNINYAWLLLQYYAAYNPRKPCGLGQ